MWETLLLDIIDQKNFNFGFPTLRTDALLKVSQWQYWWWFWFTYLFVLYYFLILRLLRTRLQQFLPKLVTSFRPHGKWGDLIICLLPISWCANILSNSNMILRMLEWQVESYLFTIRIRGKQWYWVYKFDLKTLFELLTTPKNIGNNKWVISVFGDLLKADDFLQIIQLRNFNLKLTEFWTKIVNLSFKKSKNFLSLTSPMSSESTGIDNSNFFKIEYDEVNRWAHKANGINLPLRLQKNLLNFSDDSDDWNLFELKFNNIENTITPKILNENTFFTLKQKRYTRKNLIDLKLVDLLFQPTDFNHDDLEMFNDILPKEYSYEFLKKSKILNENISIILGRRLLRTKRTLVLPSHVNLAIISNSYDVVHSWFVPGLGLKFDCVPGRATHHVLNIDNEGFYYGQCAEICGRYHHHMPIRLCALIYEHFVLWWNTFGLQKLLYLNISKKSLNDFFFKKYIW